MISNIEVLNALKECDSEEMLRGTGEFPWTRSSVIRYLEMSPAYQLTNDKYFFVIQVISRVKQFLSELKQFEERNNVVFTPNEKMQMINIIPIQPVDVHIVVALIIYNV